MSGYVLCLSGALTYEQYIQRIVDAGFGQVEIGRVAYRLLDRYTYNLEDHLLLESLDSGSPFQRTAHLHRQDGDLHWCRGFLMTQLDTFSSVVTRHLCVMAAKLAALIPETS